MDTTLAIALIAAAALVGALLGFFIATERNELKRCRTCGHDPRRHKITSKPSKVEKRLGRLS
jgi:hypothetical protein